MVQDFLLPVVAFDDADVVHELAAPHRIVQHVAVRPEPVGAHQAREVRRQAFHRHQPAPRHAAGKFGAAGPEQAFARLRVNTVGAHDERRLYRFAVGETHLGVIRCLADCDASLVERDGVRLQPHHRVGENAKQVAAVQQQMRRAEAFGESGAELEPVPGLAASPVADFAPLRNDVNARQRLLQPQRKKDACPVRTDLHAGAGFLEHT